MLDEGDFERRLIAVDWIAHEQDGFGTIPAAILGLLSSEPRERQVWRDRLELLLLPQAALGSGAFCAIPFLLELLSWRLASEEVYTILISMVICTEDESGGERGRKCREQIRSGLDIYLRDLAESVLLLATRSLALDLICRFPEARAIWEPVVRGVDDSEPNAAMRIEIREWLDND